jgi:hypothetical protein
MKVFKEIHCCAEMLAFKSTRLPALYYAGRCQAFFNATSVVVMHYYIGASLVISIRSSSCFLSSSVVGGAASSWERESGLRRRAGHAAARPALFLLLVGPRGILRLAGCS